MVRHTLANDELVPTCPPDGPFAPQRHELVTLDRIASLFETTCWPVDGPHQQSECTFDTKYGNIKIAMEQRLDKMESHVDGTKKRIEKLEVFVHHMKKTTPMWTT